MYEGVIEQFKVGIEAHIKLSISTMIIMNIRIRVVITAWIIGQQKINELIKKIN